MRQTKKDLRIFSAVKDYYGEGVAGDVSITKISLHITGRKLITLTNELKSDIFKIRENMKDNFYMNNLLLNK